MQAVLEQGYSIWEVGKMKRTLSVALSMLVLAGTSMVWADAASPGAHKVKHHKKHKVALNPQPLPPREAPGTGKTGAPTGDKSTAQ